MGRSTSGGRGTLTRQQTCPVGSGRRSSPKTSERTREPVPSAPTTTSQSASLPFPEGDVAAVDGVDGAPEAHSGARGLHGIGEQAVQRRGGDAVHRRVVGAGDAAERQVGEDRAVGEVEARALHGGALRDDVAGEAERVERPQGVAGLDDPDAVHRPLRVDLGDVHLHVAPAEGAPRGDFAHPAADDQDPPDLTHEHPPL
jgi:hypothetical protein